jgi:hypothetical protein
MSSSEEKVERKQSFYVLLFKDYLCYFRIDFVSYSTSRGI